MGTSPLVWEIIRCELADIVGDDHVSVRPAERLAYATDYYWVPQMWMDRGQPPATPDVVVRPRSADEVARVLRLANRHRVPVIPYGGGTGTQGGAVALYGGIVMDLKRMDTIVAIDERSLTVTAQPGVNGLALEEALNARGLTLAHYPASVYGATVGGYVAARGSGVLSTKYGKAEDMVLALEVVLPTGEGVRTLPVPNHACGPGLLQLFVGSEGTLGVITEVTLRLDPLPEERRFQAFLFSDVAAGLEAGRRMMTRRLRPCVIRLYDPQSTRRVVHKVLGLDVEGAYMVVGVDGPKAMVDLEAAAVADICGELGARALGPELGEHWWRHRYDFYFPPFCPALPGLFGTIESTTTFDRILPLYEAKKKTIEEGYAAWGAVYFAHFSHWFPWGAMVYDRFWIERPPQDPAEALRLHAMVWGDAARTSLRCGGTLNDHHGIGFKLGWLMPEQYGPAWKIMEGIKAQLDPNGIMNPGKLGFSRRL